LPLSPHQPNHCLASSLVCHLSHTHTQNTHAPLPPPHAAPPADDPKVQREFAFFDKVKGRLRSKEAYHDFLKCLNLFAEDVITKPELVALVHDILGRHSDLMVRSRVEGAGRWDLMVSSGAYGIVGRHSDLMVGIRNLGVGRSDPMVRRLSYQLLAM
jgi:hypothetical protein